jgi:hypothetical protein
MSMAADFDRDEVRRGLLILYPPVHGVIELDVLTKTGILPGHFDDREKLLDEIEKYDSRADVIAIYTSLNPIKTEAFKRSDHQLSIANKVASGLRIDATDVARVVGILFDIDPFRINGDKKDSTTDAEHQAALDAADFLKHKLSLMSWPEPVMGSSGNGATLRYLTDLPAAEETEDLLQRMLMAANGLLPEHLSAQVEVDGAMFDRPRISKVFGTMTRKGAGTQERPHRRSKMISAPEKLELVQLDRILKLVNAGRRNDATKDDAPRSKSTDRVKPLSDAENDSDIKPCLKAIILNKAIKQLEEVSAHEHKGRVAIATELILSGYSDDALHEFFSRLSDYDRQKTAAQLKQIVNKFVESKGGKTWLCETLRDNGVIPAGRCTECKWLGHGQDPLIVLKARIKEDPRALKEPAILAALAALKTDDPIEYDLLIDLIKKAHNGLKVATIHALIDRYILESKKPKEKPQNMPSDIAQAAQVIIDDGTAYEHISKIWQKRVKGNEYLGKALLVSRGVQSCLNSKGLHIYAHGKHGHGKSEGMEKMIELVPPEFRMDEDVSPLAIHYASKNGMLLPGTTLLIDEMVWNDSLAGIIKRIITRFQKGAGHLTVVDGESVLVRTQPRLTIWTNSADLQADEQLRDRFQDEPITEGEDYVKDIIEFQKIRDTLPDSSEGVDRETAIFQAILRDLATKTFTVKIPFATRIKIEASEGTRGYNIFSDLVKGLAAMRYAQRETNAQGQLLATEADFKDAKDIYEGSKGHSEESYTTAEIRVLQAIIDHGYKALYKDIRSITGMSEGRIKDIVNGRGKDEQKRHGLRYKCSQLDVNTVDISIVIKGTYSDRVTTHPIELSLPSTFNVNSGIRRNLVTLDPDVERRDPDVDQDVDDIDSSRDGDVVDVVEDKSKEEENTSKSSMSSVERSIPSSKEKGQKTTSPTTQLIPIAKSTASASTTPCAGYVAVKFKTPYQTDWQGTMRQFQEDEIADEVPQERADAWSKRGVVDIMEGQS